MRADELITLAAAHGVDLQHAAAVSAETRRHPARRIPLYPKSRKTTAAPLSARGTDSGTIDRPEWSLAEIGQAAQGVPPLHFWAACYAFAGDQSVYWKLWEALMGEAWHMKRQHHWPLKVEGTNGRMRFYIAEICQLVLDEDAHPHLFLGNPSVNMLDMTRKQRGTHKLTPAAISEILESNENWHILAKRFSVGWNAIRNVKLGRTFVHITQPFLQSQCPRALGSKIA